MPNKKRYNQESGTDDSSKDSDYIPDSEDEMSDVLEVNYCISKFGKDTQYCDPECNRNTLEKGDVTSESMASMDTGESMYFDDSRFESVEYHYDINNPEIVTRKYFKNSNDRSKCGRTYDKRHACCFCGQLRTNIQAHFEHAHKAHKSVKDIVDMKREIATAKEEETDLKKKLLRLQCLLRYNGDHVHNTKVCKNKKCEILLGRRNICENFDVSKYGPCVQCKEWIILDNMTKHKDICIMTSSCSKETNEQKRFTKGTSIIQSKILKGQISTTGIPSKQLLTKVFPSMKRDGITEVAQNDKLIVSLGEVWLMKKFGNKLRRKNFTSFRMRLAARPLLLLREHSNTENLRQATMRDFLVPSHFDLVVECSIKACKQNLDDELLNPSTALKLEYDLARLASAKLGFATKSQNENEKQEALDFKRLIQMEWSVRVTKLARVTLEERHFNKEKALPVPDDIVKLATYLVDTLNKLDLSEPSVDLYREVLILTEARLLLYNRRRPGELESLSVETYLHRRSLDETEISLRQNLTACESALLESQDLVEIRGKTGRGVPVLIPKETKRMLIF